MLPHLSHRFEDHKMSQPHQLPDVPTRGLFLGHGHHGLLVPTMAHDTPIAGMCAAWCQA